MRGALEKLQNCSEMLQRYPGVCRFTMGSVRYAAIVSCLSFVLTERVAPQPIQSTRRGYILLFYMRTVRVVYNILTISNGDSETKCICPGNCFVGPKGASYSAGQLNTINQYSDENLRQSFPRVGSPRRFRRHFCASNRTFLFYRVLFGFLSMWLHPEIGCFIPRKTFILGLGSDVQPSPRRKRMGWENVLK